ncbi:MULTISPECIES: hypothetical protein [unclassified Caballeronia]|uniref:hypothetical protein n=1 Tax=unclassified Caballeronia TaxID=2646786 RepID=UPI002029198D|nr:MULTISPECIES: hypothetical protein [unclassified Caballeronia]
MSQGSHSTLKRLRAYLDVHGPSFGTPATVQMLSAWASACGEAWQIADGLERGEGMRSLKRAKCLNADSVAALVHELVFELGGLVRCLPEPESIDALASDIRTFLALAARYEQASEGAEGLLKMILENQTFPVGSLQNLDHGFAVAIEAYLLGSLLRLCALQEQALQSGEASDARAVSAYSSLAARTGLAAIDTLRTLNMSRVGAMACEREAGGCRDTGDERECWWWHRYSYEVDGIQRYSRSWAGDGANGDALKTPLESERTLEIQRISAHLENDVLPPILHTVSLLVRIGQMAPRERTAP